MSRMDSRARRCIFAAALVLHLAVGFSGPELERTRDGTATASTARSDRGGVPALKPDAGPDRQQPIELAQAILPPSHEQPLRLDRAAGVVRVHRPESRRLNGRASAARAPPPLSLQA